MEPTEEINEEYIPEQSESASEWNKRHEEIETLREQIRNRVRNATGNNAYFRPALPTPTINDTGRKNVAVYARVSTLSTDQTSSIENQTQYYTKKISENPNWELQEIYSDEGKSGTSMKHRDEFRRMMDNAAEKKMDLILCASVSRFARNISDCMNQIRLLKTMNPAHPIGVYFETENIYTLDPSSNQALTVHAMLADWESANKSRRMILSYDQRICTGQYPVSDLLGYRHTKDGDLIIQPEEAKTVRFAYLAVMVGLSTSEIADILTRKHRATLKGRTEWNAKMVSSLFTNERRWGDLEARKIIITDYVEKTRIRNTGQRDSAYVPGHHVGIVTPAIANAVKNMKGFSRNKKQGVPELTVITQGALKGFVSIHPGWNAVDHMTLFNCSLDAYSLEEKESLLEEMSSGCNVKTNRQDFSGYSSTRAEDCLSHCTPSITVSCDRIQWSNTCIKKMNKCSFIEVLYHPILKMLMLRESDQTNPNRIQWISDKDHPIVSLKSEKYSEAIYTNMHWDPDLKYCLRGITRQRGNETVIFFYLDDPKVIGNKNTRMEDSCGSCLSNTLIQKRKSLMSLMTEADIQTQGHIVDNPLIGKIPTKEEILQELEELFRSM